MEPTTNRNYSRVTVTVLSVLLLASLIFGGVYFKKAHDKPAVQPTKISKPQIPAVAQAIDTKNFQAIFLLNGQAYFGHMTILDNDNYKLTDVYYSDGTTQDPLVKLGSEPHKPQNAMIIPRSNISFWENLQSTAFDGQLK